MIIYIGEIQIAHIVDDEIRTRVANLEFLKSRRVHFATVASWFGSDGIENSTNKKSKQNKSSIPLHIRHWELSIFSNLEEQRGEIDHHRAT